MTASYKRGSMVTGLFITHASPADKRLLAAAATMVGCSVGGGEEGVCRRGSTSVINSPVTIDPRLHDAVIFDLDGVVTDTASIHAAAWAAMFDDFLERRPASDHENHSPFTDDDYRHFVDGKPRHDGVADFLASRGISLPPGDPSDSAEDTVCGLGNRKQQLFLERLDAGVPVFESTVALVRKLAEAGVATAIYSSSRNCEHILKAAGLGDLFAVRVDGVVAEALGLTRQARSRCACWKPPADWARFRSGAWSSRTPRPAWQAGRNGGFALVIGVDRTGHADELAALRRRRRGCRPRRCRRAHG